MFRSFLTVGMFFFIAIESVSAQINIANFTDATNDRFTNDASFIGAGFDLSGVGRSNNNGRWGTLISPNAVLTALHVQPAVGSTFDFYPDNDPNSTPVQAIVTSTVQVGNTDLNIAILDRNVAPSIAVYNLVTDEYEGTPPITTTNPDGSTSTQTLFNVNPSNISIIGQRTLVFGRSQSPSSSLNSTRNQAVGENLVFAYSENVTFGSNTDNDTIILERDDPGTANALTHETHVRAGDSGAPTFLIDNATNELILLGVNSFRLDSAPSFFSTGVTYAGNQMEEISAILDANVIPPVLLGDCNFDGELNFLDIGPFIVILSTGDFFEEADIDENGDVNFLDIGPFISLLSN